MKPHALSVVLAGGIDPVGASLARALVRRGARVLLVARDATPLVALAGEIAPPDDHRYRVDALAADIATAYGRRAVLDAATARHVNALVNAPGAYAQRPPEPGAVRAPLEADTIDADAAAALAATMQLTRVLLPLLLSRPDARVLNIGPSFNAASRADAPALRVAQNALRGASESLRHAVAGGSVRVQFLGRRFYAPAAHAEPATAQRPAAPARSDRPEYIASVAVQMLLAGTRERFLGFRGDMMAVVEALLGALLDPAPRHRRA